MSDWHVVKEFWGIFAGLAALWARIEVAQALNRQNISALWARRNEDQTNISSILKDMREEAKDMRQDFKAELRLLRTAIENRRTE
jgi:hypothetical protein